MRVPRRRLRTTARTPLSKQQPTWRPQSWLDKGTQRYARIDKTGGNLDVRDPTTRIPISLVEVNGGVFFANSSPPSLERSNSDLASAGEIATLSECAQGLARGSSGDRMTWCEPVGGAVREARAAGMSIDTVAIDELGCRSTASDSFARYWTRQGNVVGKPRQGQPVVVATNQDSPFALASDDEGTFWLTRDGTLRTSSVLQHPDAGGAVTTLSSGFTVDFADARIVALALTPTYVVWATSDGKILRHHR